MSDNVTKGPSSKERLSTLFESYGRIGLWTYFTLSIATIAGYFFAFKFGFRVTSSAGTWGLLGAAWVAAKLSMPIRILATLALTPLVAAAHRRFRLSTQAAGDAAAPDA